LLALWSLVVRGAEVAAPAAAGPHRAPQTQPASIRIGIAPGTWQGLNRNDASAAIAAWARSILAQRGSAVAADTELFDSAKGLADALHAGQVDCASMLTDQFLGLDPALQPDQIFLSVNDGSIAERYLVLVRENSAIHDLSGLRAQKLLVQATARASLAMPWLDGVLASDSLDRSEKLLASVVRVEKPAKAVLGVYFQQAAACLVTSNAFEVACELNPKLRRDLRVLAMSPEVVPALFFFRPGYNSTAREELEPALVSLHETAAGRQVLTVFQSDRMIRRPISCLDASRKVLEGGAGANTPPATVQ
jgi:phosphonate transport system substrate-binding protein